MQLVGVQPREKKTLLEERIPDGEYGTKDFERILSYKARTKAVAQNLSDYMVQMDSLRQNYCFLRGSGTCGGHEKGAQ